MSKEFKAGDPVYFPVQGTQVFQVEDYSCLYYPLAVTFYYDDGDKGFDTFTLEGFVSKTHKTPLLFHVQKQKNLFRFLMLVVQYYHLLLLYLFYLQKQI